MNRTMEAPASAGTQAAGDSIVLEEEIDPVSVAARLLLVRCTALAPSLCVVCCPCSLRRA